MTLSTIQSHPTTLENIHESCFRSYHILNHVLKMIDRGDSKETINEVVEMLNSHPIVTSFAAPGNQ